MKETYCKTKFSTIALILVLGISAILVALPVATAQEPPTMRSYAFLGVVPNPVGIDQTVLLHVGITHPVMWPQTGWKNLTVTVIKPDNTTDTLGPVDTDPTGGTGVEYVPHQVGTYVLQSHFPEQLLTTDCFGTPAGTVFEASNSEEVELVVQEEPLPAHPGVSWPSEYWSRPIDAQLREWWKISGNWLVSMAYQSDMEAPYNELAPESPHILWAKPLLGTVGGALGGGLVGGNTWVLSFEEGDAYEGYFTPPVIIAGVLYFNRYKADGGNLVEQEVVAVDLRTGEELWAKPLIGPDGESHRLEFGQLFLWDSFNVHGIYAYLWAIDGSTWHAFEASSGRYIYSMTNVPAFMFWGGFAPNTMFGSKGEIISYTINYGNGWMAKWNSEEVIIQKRLNDTGGQPGSLAGSWIPEYMGTTVDAGYGYEWNVTIPTGLASPPLFSYKVFPGDRIVGSNIYKSTKQPDTVQFWGISLEEEHRGTLLFNTTWQPPPEAEDAILMFEAASVEDGVFIVVAGDTRQRWGFDIDTGEEIWGPSDPQHYLDRYTYSSAFSWETIYHGKIYSAGMSGIVYCYNVTTGQLLWTYENKNPYVLSERYQQEVGNNYFSTMMLFFADGKLYISDNEHSPSNPLPRDTPLICLDAETGELVWKADGLVKSTVWGGQAAIGDSIIATINTYDSRVYAIGKGPSATTVTASPKVLAKGSSVQIEGMVTDEAAGTKDERVVARFPHGVPAVSDESMGEWMKFVYNQFPCPEDVTGVQVKLTAIDPNGGTVDIGTVTTDGAGIFKKMWSPDSEGEYTIIATFEGTKSYWNSYAETTIGVGPASADSGYQGPSADEIAQATVNKLPPYPSASEVAQETINRLPAYPSVPSATEIAQETANRIPELAMPAYQAIDLVILVLIAVGLVIGLLAYMTLRKQK